MASLKSLFSRLLATDSQVDAEDLRRSSRDDGSTPASDCCAGEVVTVRGVVRSVTLEPSGTLPSMEAVVFDGSGGVKLVWLGRRRIVGIEPGRRLRATGRVTGRVGDPVLFNPRYELLPAESA